MMRLSALFGVALVVLATCAAADEPASPPRASATGVLFTCKMHPQIRWSTPADCPLCGMKLVRIDGGKGPNSSSAEGAAEAMDMSGHDHAGMHHSSMHSGMGGCGMCMEMMGMGGMNHGAAPATQKVTPARYRGGRGRCGC